MNRLHEALPTRQRGAALLIVLAFVVLLTGVSVAYLSRTTGDRQVAHGSFYQSNVDQLAQSAMDSIIGDLRQEIANGSTAYAEADGTTLYVPRDTGAGAAANMVPQRSGNTATGPNLIRLSIRSDTLSGNPAPPSRASAVNSTTDASASGRFVTLARWNTHYLLPKANTLNDDSYPPSPLPAPFNPYTPVPNGFTPPDWVFVTPTGATVITPPPATSVIGRYAYAIYAEDGLLDMNVAGFPTDAVASTAVTWPGRKGSLAYADLTALGTTDANRLSNPDAGNIYQVDRLVGWRNYATTRPTNNFPNTGGQAFAKNFQTDTASTRPAALFCSYVLGNTNGFLSANNGTWNGRTDQTFVQRQELIGFRKTVGNTGSFSANVLQYLSTFSRETNAPSFSPSTPQGSTIDYAALASTSTAVNPNFLLRRATTNFTRLDGTTAVVGEPLVKTRFPLSRLAWITYKGPSALLATSDSVYQALISAGVSTTTISAGTTNNIKRCFGLTFPTGGTPGSPWTYTNPNGSIAANRILRLDEVAAAGREPDFFELLQAGILSGSLGQSTNGGVTGQNNNTDGSGLVFPDIHMSSTIQHLLTIGACIIDQADPDSIPTRIQFIGTNGNTWTAYGVENLPYITQLYPIAGTSPNTPTQWATYLLFQLWNPHQNASTLPNNVRLRVDGAIGMFTGGNVGNKWIAGTSPQLTATGQSVILNSAFSFSAPAPLTNVDTTNAAPAPGAAGTFAVLAAPTVP